MAVAKLLTINIPPNIITIMYTLSALFSFKLINESSA